MGRQEFADASGDRILRRVHAFGEGRHGGPRLLRPVRWASWGGFLLLLVLRNPGAEGHRLRAVGRLAGWQLWRRVVRRPILVRYEGGPEIEFPPWHTLAGITAATGMHEPAEQRFLRRFARAGGVAIDVGANIGIYSLPLAAAGCQVIAVEPSTKTRRILEANVERNGLAARVRVVPAALADRSGEAFLTLELDAANHLVEERGESAVERVEVRTLADVVEEARAWLQGPVTFVKVDAEGHDAAVLAGSGALLRDDRPVVVVETWGGGREVRDILEGHGYRIHRFDAGSGRLIELSQRWTGDANFVAVHPERLDDVAARVAVPTPGELDLPAIRWRASRRDAR